MSKREDPESSGCAGTVVVTAAVLGAVYGTYAASRTAFILLVWIIGWGAVIWAAKQVPATSNPAPPPLPEGGPEEEPQVSTLRDKSHPNRWLITRPSRWLAVEHDKETGTT